MNAEELEKIVARHEMRCHELKVSFSVECIWENCLAAAETVGMVYDGR